MSLIEDFIKIRIGLQDCARRAAATSQLQLSQQTLWHLGYGIGRRLFILLTNYEAIASIVPEEREEPITLDEQNDLDVHLNSLFFHIAGLLDNLAWAIHHHYGIPGGVDEQKRSGLNKIGLFTKDFKKALLNVNPDFALLIEPYTEWNKVLKKLRDPIAHRIPIYAVPALLNNDESKLYQAKYSEFMTGIGKRTEEESDKLLEELRHIGTYRPVFDLSDSYSGTLYPIRERIDIDLSNTTKIVSNGLELFKKVQAGAP